MEANLLTLEALEKLCSSGCKYLYQNSNTNTELFDMDTHEYIVELIPCNSEDEVNACHTQYTGCENNVWNVCEDLDELREMARGVSGIRFHLKQ